RNEYAAIAASNPGPALPGLTKRASARSFRESLGSLVGCSPKNKLWRNRVSVLFPSACTAFFDRLMNTLSENVIRFDQPPFHALKKTTRGGSSSFGFVIFWPT